MSALDSVQIWPNRDPIGERGGVNLYDFTRNQPTDLVDIFGLECKSDCLKTLTSCLNQALFDAAGGAIIGVPIGIVTTGGGFRGPKGNPRPFCRAGGLTGLGKGAVSGGLGGFAGGLFLGELGCYSSYAGCLSGCPPPPKPPPPTCPPLPPPPPDCNVNTPPMMSF